MISSWILPQKKEAEQFASDMDWRYVDENQFEWRLAVEEDPTAEKTGNQKTATRRKWRLKASPMRSAKYFGIETGENSFGYIASWSQGKRAEKS